MKKNVHVFSALMFIALAASAQDEGNIVIKDRFERDKTIYLSLGPSFTLGKNLGDYSTGFNFEAGFLLRSNKLISWGPSLSFLSFAYDENKTYKYYYDVDNDRALELAQSGGDVHLASLGINLKLNFIPVSDNSVFSVYGILNPFVSFVSRTAVVEEVDIFTDDNDDIIYTDYAGHVTYDADPGPDQSDPGYPALGAKNKFTGGAHLGLGVEFMPAKKFSFFGQFTFSYTLPISYVATDAFLKDEDKYVDELDRVYYDASQSLFKDDFPITKKGFSAISIKVGMAFNF